MSNGQTKRVNLTLHLSPGDSQADLRTVAKLSQWHGQLQQSAEAREDVAAEMRTFHRDVYLAGLQLHLLNPQLCHHVAESMGREHLTLPELVTELVRCGLLPKGTPIGATEKSNEDFSAQQLEQLQKLLQQAIPESLPAAPAAVTTEAAVSQPAQEMSAAQQAEFAHLRRELEGMRTLLEQQSLQLAQMRRSEKAAVQAVSPASNNAEEMNLAEMDAPTEKMKKIRQKGIF
ncbi:MAG TPA: hypothetical protein VGH05_05810 [Buttiauxella sp.]|jgi:hypothetical protein